MKISLFLFALLISPLGAAIVLDGDFAPGQPGWTPYDNNSTTTVNLDFAAVGESGVAGDFALKVTSRDDKTEGVKQDLIGALTAGAGLQGQNVVTRLSVKLDAFASVRCYLLFKDLGGTQYRPIILAEQVVRTVGQWVHIEGVSKLEWTGSPTKALLIFEVVQYGNQNSLPSTTLPSYTIDNISIDLDDDADGVTNAEELAHVPPLAIDNPDSDGDHLPDGWEIAHGTNPKIADAHSDLDGDTFTNIEEYFGATNPNGPQTPGIPVNPNADTPTRALLSYLALAPSRRFLPDGSTGCHVLVGQMVSNSLPANALLPDAFDNNVTRLATDTGRWPAIVGFAAEGNTQPMQIPEVADEAIQWLADGGIVQIKFRPWNPWTNTLNGIVGVNIDQLINSPASAPSLLFHDWLDQLATEFARIKDPAQGGSANATILFRPYSEMNGGWFWWGHLSREDYEALWRHTYNYLTITHGLNHLLWVYESDAAEHSPSGPGLVATASDYYYPGDDVVDVIGHNLYSDTWDLPFDELAVYSRYPKVVAIPQAGSASTNPPANGIHRASGSFDNLTYLEKIQNRYPRTSFFIVWNSFPGGANGYQNVSIVDNLNASALMAHPEVVTRKDLAADLEPVPLGSGTHNGLALGLSGKTKHTTSKRRISLGGWSTGAARVEYRTGGRSRSAEGTDSWKFTTRLPRGRSRYTLNAIASDGRVSSGINLTVIRKP